MTPPLAERLGLVHTEQEHETVSETPEDHIKECTDANKHAGVPSWKDIAHNFASEQSTHEWLTQEGILSLPTDCPKCGTMLGPCDSNKAI